MGTVSQHPNWTVILPLIVSVFLAFAGYYFTRQNEMRAEQRKARLLRVDSQLKELYGPLYAISSSNSRLWTEFRKKYRAKHRDYFDPSDPPTPAEAEAWRLWMREVFVPMNQQLELLITQHTDLMEEPEMPVLLLDFMAHSVSYRPILKAWEKGDFSINTSLINFPEQDSLLEYAKSDYQLLKTRQAKLLGQLKGSASN